MASLYLVAIGILLSLVATPPAVLSQVFACYASTDCHGVTVESLPQRGECCAGRGLSFTLEGENHCRNCFSVEEFMSEGSEFYLAFFDNLDIGEFLTRAQTTVRVNNMENISQTVSIVYESKIEQIEIDSGGSVDFDIPVNIRFEDVGDMDKGISIQSVNGAKLSVTAFGNELTSSDTYQLLPHVYLPSMYEYYAVSVQLENNTIIDDGEVITPDPSGDSVLVVVASENNTQVTITPTQNIFIVPENETPAWKPLSLTLNKRETLFVSSLEDLTGTHVISDKPVSVFSGHECGSVPYNVPYCDHLVEQIPPTATWGREFYTMSIKSRTEDYFKAITLKDDNTIRSECTDVNGVLINSIIAFPPGAGQAVEFALPSNQFCRFTSDFPILLVQFSIGGSADQMLFADPFMTIIPPIPQYRHFYMLNYFQSLRNSNFLNIVLLNTSGAMTGDTLLNGERINSSIVWTEIQCEFESDVCAYGVQVDIGEGSDTMTLSHMNEDAQLVGIPYSMGYRTGSGTFSGMSQKPIALDTVTLNGLGYIGNKANEVVTITVTRSGDLLDNITVPFRAQAIPDDANAAIPGVDFVEVEMDVLFPAQVASVNVEVPLGLGDTFPGEDRVFEVYLGATPGVFVSPTAYTTVTIIHPYPTRPVLSTIEPVNATALKLKWSGNTYNVSTSVHYQSIFTETGAVMNHFDTTVEANITSLEITVQDCVPGYHHNFFLQFIVPVIGSLATTASFIFDKAYFQVQFKPVENCLTFGLEKSARIEAQLMLHITRIILERCTNCTKFSEQFLRQGVFICHSNPTTVTYRSILVNPFPTIPTHTSYMMDIIQNWIFTSPSLKIDWLLVRVNSNCPARISSLDVPECVSRAVMCPQLPVPASGIIDQTDTTVGSVASYSCGNGFELVGSMTRACQSDGMWSGVDPQCIPPAVFCPLLPVPLNGTIDPTSNTIGSIASYSCDVGYELVGNMMRVCQSNGMWDGEDPQCRPLAVLCPPPRAPLNGTIELSGVTVGSMASYSCDVGYELVGNTMRVCQSDGMWDGVVPQCRPLAISVSYAERRYNVIESGEVTFSVCVITEDNEASLRPFILNSATVDGTATAPSDYVTLNDFLSFNVGDSRVCHMITIVDDIICEVPSESFFLSLTVGTSENITIRRPLTEVVISDEGEPECAVCPSLLDPLNGGVMWTNLSVGSVATYTCNSGFELVGNEMRTCQSDGVWSGEEPVCTGAALQFVLLTDAATPLPMEDDAVSLPIVPPGGIPIFGQTHTNLFVISNGVIFFDMAIEGFFPTEVTNFARIHEEYPDITPFLAPYWIDNDPSVAGLVSYEVFTGDSTQLNEVSEFISQSQCVQFTGTWMLVAEWDDVPPFSTDNETLSTYQGVVVTDGSSTYAVFIYLCGFIHENSTGAGIGYYINTTTFVEHPLSQTEMSPLIACENEASPWTNLIYQLASSVSTLQFLSVGDTVGVQRTFLPPFDNALSGDISPPSEGFPLFFSNARSINVHENGLIFFDGHTGVTAPQSINSIPFGSASFVAPYWVDNDPSSGGIISYEVHTASNPLLSQVSQYVSNNRGSQFCGTWMLVADWRDVPVFDESGTNSYQGVLITDGVNSYAVFIYECGQLAEGVVARIGYYISDGDGATALEHPFSGEVSSTIGCEVPNVVYDLTTLF